MTHIGIVGPIHIPSLNIEFQNNQERLPIGMGGSPVNHEINALLDKGYKISVFTLSPEIDKDKSLEWHHPQISIFMGPYRKRARYRALDFFRKEKKYLTNAILKAAPEVIHAHWQYEWGWAALNSKIPALITCHDAPFQILKARPDLYRFYRLLMAIVVLRKAKHLTAVSPYTADGLKFITRKKISVISNFEPDETFLLYKTKTTDRAVKIAMINSVFYGLKNVMMGVKAFKECQKTNPNLELHLYGSGHGPNGDAFNWCKKENIINNVFFHGELPFKELMTELSKAQILLHTSVVESCPMVLIEAMAMGIPVIAGNKSGGVPWVLKDGGGILVNISSAKSIAEGLIKLTDPLTYTKLSKEARDIALRRFTKKVVINQYIEQLNKISK